MICKNGVHDGLPAGHRCEGASRHILGDSNDPDIKTVAEGSLGKTLDLLTFPERNNDVVIEVSTTIPREPGLKLPSQPALAEIQLPICERAVMYI